MSIDKCQTLNSIQMRNIFCYCSQWKLDWPRFPKFAYTCGSSWDSNSCLEKSQLDFFHQAFSGQFYLCVWFFDKSIPKYVRCISTLVGWNWQNCDLLCLFSIINLIFSRCTGWISTIKISQDSFIFSEGDSEKHLRLCTSLWSPNNSIMPKIAEMNGEMDIGGERLKLDWKHYSRFLN